MEPLKNMFSKPSYQRLALECKIAERNFDEKRLLKEALRNIEPLSLNERMRRTSFFLNKYLLLDFAHVIEVFKKVIIKMPAGYTNLVFPDYVGIYGHNHFDISMDSLEFFTQ